MCVGSDEVVQYGSRLSDGCANQHIHFLSQKEIISQLYGHQFKCYVTLSDSAQIVSKSFSRQWGTLMSQGRQSCTCMPYIKLILQTYISWNSFLKNLSFFLCFFFKILFIYFQREEKGGRKRRRERSVCGCLSHAPYWGPGLQPRHVSQTGFQTSDPLVHRLCSIH